MDTALSVATEMVAELDITDQDVSRIADMIDGEIASLVPEWRPGPGIEETTHFANQNFCINCVSNHASGGTDMDLMSHSQGGNGKNLQLLQCCRHGCASMHGRFEEITFQSEEYDNHVTEDAPNISSQSDCLQYQESWNHHESRELSPVESVRSHSDDQYEHLDKSAFAEDKGHDVWENNVENEYEKEIQQELRWLRAKYQMELMELKDKQLGLAATADRKHKTEQDFMALPLTETAKEDHEIHLKPFGNNWNCDSSCESQVQKSHPNLDTQRAQNCEVMCSHGEGMVTAKSFYTGTLHRTVSLPVDAVDV